MDDDDAASNSKVFRRAAWPVLCICSMIPHLEALEERYNFLMLKYTNVKCYPSVERLSGEHTHLKNEKLILFVPLILFENPLRWHERSLSL